MLHDTFCDVKCNVFQTTTFIKCIKFKEIFRLKLILISVTIYRGKENSQSLLISGYRLGAGLFTGLSHICTPFEGRLRIFQDMPYTEAILVESSLITYFPTKGAERFLIHYRIVDVFPFMHCQSSCLNALPCEFCKKYEIQ